MARVPYLDRADLAPNIRTCWLAISIFFARWCTAPNARAPSAGSATLSASRASSIRGCARWRSCRSVISRARRTNIPITSRSAVISASATTISAPSPRRPRAARPRSMPLSRNVLRAAREMTNGLAISDATFAALSKDLDNERLTDLVVTIGFYTARRARPRDHADRRRGRVPALSRRVSAAEGLTRRAITRLQVRGLHHGAPLRRAPGRESRRTPRRADLGARRERSPGPC